MSMCVCLSLCMGKAGFPYIISFFFNPNLQFLIDLNLVMSKNYDKSNY